MCHVSESDVLKDSSRAGWGKHKHHLPLNLGRKKNLGKGDTPLPRQAQISKLIGPWTSKKGKVKVRSSFPDQSGRSIIPLVKMIGWGRGLGTQKSAGRRGKVKVPGTMEKKLASKKFPLKVCETQWTDRPNLKRGVTEKDGEVS